MELETMMGLNTVKVLAGCLPTGDYVFDGIFLKGTGATINLATELKEINQKSQEAAKHWLTAISVGAILLLMGPLVAIMGAILSGNKNNICAELVFNRIDKKTGRNEKCLAVMDSKVHNRMLAFAHANTDVTDTGK